MRACYGNNNNKKTKEMWLIVIKIQQKERGATKTHLNTLFLLYYENYSIKNRKKKKKKGTETENAM